MSAREMPQLRVISVVVEFETIRRWNKEYDKLFSKYAIKPCIKGIEIAICSWINIERIFQLNYKGKQQK